MSEIFKMLQAMDEAMKAEGIPEMQREHVINRLVYGDPHPGRRAAREKEQQERTSGGTHSGIVVNMSSQPVDAAHLVRSAIQHYNERMAVINRRFPASG